MRSAGIRAPRHDQGGSAAASITTSPVERPGVHARLSLNYDLFR